MLIVVYLLDPVLFRECSSIAFQALLSKVCSLPGCQPMLKQVVLACTACAAIYLVTPAHQRCHLGKARYVHGS